MNPNRPPFFQSTVKGKAHPTNSPGACGRLQRREREREEKRDERARERARPHRRRLTLVSFVTGVCHPDAWTLGEEARGCVLLEDLRTQLVKHYWARGHHGGYFFCFLLLPRLVGLLSCLCSSGSMSFCSCFLFLGEWVSEWEEVGTLCARACVCLQKGYPVGLFFVPRLRIWWGAAICCCCSAAASIVMWGCRKWHSLLER